ncbi:MAG: hypothetical protein RIS85_1341 [Pseudomonadota bacterium]|jgi:pyrroline-5-carboxylate reductase
MKQTLGIVGGGGWLGGAIARAALNQGVLQPEALTLSWRSAPPRNMPGVRLTQDNCALCDSADIVMLSVRPEDWPAVAHPVPGKLVISVMAGVSLETLARAHQTTRVIRALPNAAAEVGASYTPLVAHNGATQADRDFARRLFEACGAVDDVQDEGHLDYLSGLTGTGPAYPSLMAAAMVEDAVARGLPETIAQRAVNTMFVGTGRLIEAGNPDPASTVETFTAYRGVTAAGLDAMAQAGLPQAVRAGLAAALARTTQMNDAANS